MSAAKRITFSSLRSEAVRNVRSGTSGALLLGTLWFIVLMTTLVWNTVTVIAIVDAAQRYQDSGAATTIVESADNISGTLCESMSSIPNVTFAGALRESSAPIRPAATPGVDLPTFDASPGLVSLLMNGAGERDGIFTSRQVAGALGVSRGSTLTTADGEGAVSGVFDYPEDGRRAGLGYAAVQSVAPSETFDECWVSVWPESDRVRAVVAASVLASAPADDAPPVITQLNSSLGASFEAERRYRDRATALVPLGTLLVGAGLGCSSVRTRRLELASARLVGVRIADQMSHLSLEQVMWVGASSIAAFVASTAVVLSCAPALAVPAMHTAVLTLAGGAVAMWAGSMLALATISSRRTIDYFKNR